MKEGGYYHISKYQHIEINETCIAIEHNLPRSESKSKQSPILWSWWWHILFTFLSTIVILIDRFVKKLDSNERKTDFLNTCIEHLKSENVTLLYAAKSERENNAIVVQNWIIKCLTCCYNNIHVDKQTVWCKRKKNFINWFNNRKD